MNKPESGNKNICIVTFPISEAGVFPLSNLVSVLQKIAGRLFLITGQAGFRYYQDKPAITTIEVRHQLRSNSITRVIRYTATQFAIAWKAVRLSRKVDLYVFSIGGTSLLVPLLALKIMRKKVIMVIAGSSAKSMRGDKRLLSLPIRLLEHLGLALSNRIVVYSRSLIEECNLQKFISRVDVAHKHFLDLENFRPIQPLADREPLVGYIGRFSEEKGILNFVSSIACLNKQGLSFRFIICGDGELRDSVNRQIKTGGLESVVKITGWIPHQDLPAYLNQMLLLVLPSFTEGLPNIMLEAMACGTPVLANSVGGIPDIIIDGQTGFLMNTNTPESIAENIRRAINNPGLETIAVRARSLMEKEFTFERAVQKYRTLINRS